MTRVDLAVLTGVLVLAGCTANDSEEAPTSSAEMPAAPSADSSTTSSIVASEMDEPDSHDVDLFNPLGQAGCDPPSPYLDWFEGDGTGQGLAEVRATPSGVEAWGLLWESPPLTVGTEIKMVWRATGSGDFAVRATLDGSGEEAALTFGPEHHDDSSFDRAGEEWGTAFVFPSAGCWEIEIARESGTASIWVEVIPPPEDWTVAANHSVVGRVFPVVVWTGSELFVWGGEKPSETAWHGDGAAYDPGSDSWRQLAPSPMAPRSEHVAVWTGSEVIVCCGRRVGEGVRTAAYDPAADSWREIASPLVGPTFAEAVWTGSEMMVFGGVGQFGLGDLVESVAYSPKTDSWRRLADLPYALERSADAVMGDGVVYAWPSAGSFPSTPLIYNIATDEWRQLPVPPEPSPVSPSLVWTGRELFAWGLGPSESGVGVLFDPSTETWRETAPAPLERVPSTEGKEGSQAVAVAGKEIIVWTGWVGADWESPATPVLAYDPASDSWRNLESAPLRAQGLWHEPIIWTGNELIAYTDPLLVYRP